MTLVEQEAKGLAFGMRIILLLIALCASVFAAETLELPETVKLTNGAVLKKISVIRWTSDGVVLKHAGGADPVRFVHIDASQRATFEALAKEAKKAPSPASGATVAAASMKFKGQAFITTRGAGSYKLSGMKVYVFPEGTEALFQTNLTVQLPQPIASASTDADGKFSFSLPSKQGFFLFAQGRRLVGKYEELYEWRIPSSEISNPDAVMLTTENHRDKHTRVQIAN